MNYPKRSSLFAEPKRGSLFADEESPSPKRGSLFADEESPSPKRGSLFAHEDSPSPKRGSLFADEESPSPKRGSLFADDDSPSPKRGSLFADDDSPSPKRGSLFADDDSPSPKRGSLFADEESPSPKRGSLFAHEDSPSPKRRNAQKKVSFVFEDKKLEDLLLENYTFGDVSKRLESFFILHEYMRDLKKNNLICSLDSEWHVKKESFGGISDEKDINAEAFKVYTNSDNEILKAIGTKLLRDTERNRCEIKYYNYFTDIVLTNQNPHFPLVSVSQECKMCKACDGIYLKEQECILVFSELADGSASSYFPLSMKKNKINELLSMTCQTLMACLTLEKHEIVHGDLHLGNILYHEEDEEKKNSGKYFHYLYNDYHIYVKHLGKLWVLWDFGNTTANGEIHPKYGEISDNTLNVDVNRLFNLVNDRLYKFEEFKDVFKGFKDNAKNVFDVLINIKENIKDILIVSQYERFDINTIDPVYEIKDRIRKERICMPNIGIVESKKMTLEL